MVYPHRLLPRSEPALCIFSGMVPARKGIDRVQILAASPGGIGRTKRMKLGCLSFELNAGRQQSPSMSLPLLEQPVPLIPLQVDIQPTPNRREPNVAATISYVSRPCLQCRNCKGYRKPSPDSSPLRTHGSH